ncbi:MAG: hypothetical protein JXQ73_10195 [Phycisphaerae bacterium]|nr:hypothetical protein [Phycisphaerae bacterium]
MQQDDPAVAASVQKSSTPGLQVVTLRRQSCEEVFVTATPVVEESASALFRKAGTVLRDKGAQVVSVEIFGLSNEGGAGMKALERALGPIAWPVTWLENGNRAGMSGVQVWAVTGVPVEPIQVRGRLLGTVFDDGYARLCRLGGLVAADGSRSREDQTQDVLDLMVAGLQAAGMTFDQVVRTWFCNYEILDWYGEFNQVRNAFFKANNVYEGLVPASTGVGGRNAAAAALISGLLAVKAKSDDARAFAVPSPLQCPALEYGSSFSRAAEIKMPDHRRLLVSGSASIAPEGHTVHLGDVEAQVELTMKVVHAILDSRRMGWDDVSRAIAYLKYAEDVSAFEKYCAAEGLEEMPVVRVHGDICRDDLLFEIELDAIVPS